MIRFALPLLAAAALLCMPSLHAADDATQAAGLDSNQDGLVSRAEAEYDGKLGVRFDTLDINKDGRLDSSELPGLQAAVPGTANVGALNGAVRSSSSGNMGGATAPASSSAGPAVPSTPGLPSSGGRVAAPAGAAPSGAQPGGR